jgi:hypothetical protein
MGTLKTPQPGGEPLYYEQKKKENEKAWYNLRKLGCKIG